MLAIDGVVYAQPTGATVAPGLPHRRPPASPKILDACTLRDDESLDGRDYSGWTLKGNFSHRRMVGVILVDAILDRCTLYGANMRCANLCGASLKYVDARRVDLRGSSLAAACVEGARLCRALLDRACMAGMWGGPCNEKLAFRAEKPEIKALLEGSMPPTQPLAPNSDDAKEWEDEVADAAKDKTEDDQDEEARERRMLWLQTQLTMADACAGKQEQNKLWTTPCFSALRLAGPPDDGFRQQKLETADSANVANDSLRV